MSRDVLSGVLSPSVEGARPRTCDQGSDNTILGKRVGV